MNMQRNPHPIECEDKPMTERVELLGELHKRKDEYAQQFEYARHDADESRQKYWGAKLEETLWFIHHLNAMKPPVSPNCALREALEKIRERFPNPVDKSVSPWLNQIHDIVNEALAQAPVEPTGEA
jgi:hypothetical protein